MMIPRFRRIEQVLKEIKEFDPNTELNWRIIKGFINDGLLTGIKIGNAWLINIDELYEEFSYKLIRKNRNILFYSRKC